MKFRDVMPAITTPFDDQGAVDHASLRRHAAWLVDHGCSAIIGLGSLGEGNSLSFDEKLDLLRSLVESVGDRVPVVASIAALSTREAVGLARGAAQLGCAGLMVLPPYVHKGPWSETRAHFDAVIEATELPCMLYNNPIAYGTDLLPEQIADFAARHQNVTAVKESSGDLRRLTAVRALVGDRLNLCAGLDDMALEAARLGADGWVAGLVNALPRESVAVFELGRTDYERGFELYRWFLPLLRLDCQVDFVQQIKLVQAEVDMGSERVRPPRQPLAPEVKAASLALIREHLAQRPEVSA